MLARSLQSTPMMLDKYYISHHNTTPSPMGLAMSIKTNMIQQNLKPTDKINTISIKKLYSNNKLKAAKKLRSGTGSRQRLHCAAYPDSNGRKPQKQSVCFTFACPSIIPFMPATAGRMLALRGGRQAREAIQGRWLAADSEN